MQKIEAYGEIRQLAPDLHILDGEWQETAFKRRMTLVRLESGGLLVHNAIPLHEADYAKLERLGRPEIIVAPNFFHGSEAHIYKNRYPQARLLVPESAARAIGRRCRVDGVLPDWDDRLRAEVDCMEVEGTRLLQECVFLHRASRTLIVTDLVFNMQVDFQGFELKFARWNGIDKQFGPSKVFKIVFVRNKKELARSVERILEWDFDRVILNHGEVLESGGKDGIRTGFVRLGLL